MQPLATGSFLRQAGWRQRHLTVAQRSERLVKLYAEVGLATRQAGRQAGNDALVEWSAAVFAPSGNSHAVVLSQLSHLHAARDLMGSLAWGCTAMATAAERSSCISRS